MRLSSIKDKITGTHVKEYFSSKFKLWCNFHAPLSEKDPPSAYITLLTEKGKKFENRLINQNYPKIKEIRVKTTEEILQELCKGKKVFSNLTIFQDNLIGKPDLLIKNIGESVFGEYHYIVKEIKSAKHVKKSHIMQAAFYNYILGQMQSFTPEQFYLINSEGKEYGYEYKKYEKQLLEALEEIKEIQKGKMIAPALGTGYPWRSYAQKKALQNKDLTIIQGISERSRDYFLEAGYDTIRKIHLTPERELLKMEKLGPTAIKKIKRSAEAWIKEKHLIVGTHCFRPAAVELFLDLEATQPDEQLGIKETCNYLFGLLHQERYFPFVAKTWNDEEKIFRKFLAFIEQFDDFIIYTYSSFEQQQLKKMCQEYGIKKEMQEKLFKNTEDLFKVLKKTVVLPTMGESLKEVAKYLGFNWRQEDVSGQESMAMYLKYLETKDGKILKRIINYNEDDVIATKIVKDWLVKQTKS